MNTMVYPSTNFKATEQLIVARGEGVYVYDDRGRRYLEGMAGLWCTSLGYGNEELIEAAEQQMRTLTYSHMFGGKSHPVAMELADKLAARVPVENARIFFGNSGSDANDTVMKLLRYHAMATGQEQRFKVIARDKGYHGVTMASAALTGIPTNHTHFQLPFEALGVLRTGSPHYYREAQVGESEEAFVDRRMAELETLIQAEGPDTIAAFIAEPVNGAGGVIVPPKNYFQKLSQLLDKYGIMLWSDEVICGFGRLGEEFGASAVGMQPAMMTFAKALSSAYMPLSAAAIPGALYDELVEPVGQVGVFGHGYTYSGHPVACAVASKVLDIYERDKLYVHAAHVGGRLQDRLRTLSDHPLVGEVRGMGLIAAVELVANKETREPFASNAVGVYCQKQCEERGLILRALGGNSVAICPPLVITEEHVEDLVGTLAEALDATLDYVHAEKR